MNFDAEQMNIPQLKSLQTSNLKDPSLVELPKSQSKRVCGTRTPASTATGFDEKIQGKQEENAEESDLYPKIEKEIKRKRRAVLFRMDSTL